MVNRKVFYIAPLVLGGLLVSLVAYQNKLAARQIEIPAGTRLSVRLNQTLDTSHHRGGRYVLGEAG